MIRSVAGALALGVAVGACRAAPAVTGGAAPTFLGPGWSVALPADLDLTPRGGALTAWGATLGDLVETARSLRVAAS